MLKGSHSQRPYPQSHVKSLGWNWCLTKNWLNRFFVMGWPMWNIITNASYRKVINVTLYVKLEQTKSWWHISTLVLVNLWKCVSAASCSRNTLIYPINCKTIRWQAFCFFNKENRPMSFSSNGISFSCDGFRLQTALSACVTYEWKKHIGNKVKMKCRSSDE